MFWLHIRSQLTALRPMEFIWRPYEDVVGRLPPYCREGQHIRAYNSWLINWNMVEPHPVHRVARQLGFYQSTPTDHLLMTPNDHQKLHKIKKTGSKDNNWVSKNAHFIAYWNDMSNNLFNGVYVATNAQDTDNDYMQWYFDRTVLFITNPGDAGPSNSYRDWDGQAQAYAEEFRHIHERAQQRMDDQAGSGGQGGGTNQALKEFQQIPQYMVNFGGGMDRMNYNSQQFQFPAPDYYPQQPDNQFETYQPGPQFETYQPDNQFETYQPGPPDYDLDFPPGFELPHSNVGSYYDSGPNVHQTNIRSSFAEEIFGTPMTSQPNYYGGSSNVAPINQYNEYGGERMDLTPIHMANLSDFSSGWGTPNFNNAT